MEPETNTPNFTNPPNILNGLEIPMNDSRCAKFLLGIIRAATPVESYKPSLLINGNLLKIFPSKLWT